MMRSEPHPSSTAEKSRFSTMAVTAIHQRLAKAVARVGAMLEGKKGRSGEKQQAAEEEGNLQSRASLTDAQDEERAITYL